MPALDLALRLRVVGRAADMADALVVEPLGEITPTRPWAASRLRPRAGRPSSVGAQRPARSHREKS